MNMRGLISTTYASSVYTVIGINSDETAGKQISYIMALTLNVTGCRSFEIHAWVSKSLCIDSNKNKKVLHLIPIST